MRPTEKMTKAEFLDALRWREADAEPPNYGELVLVRIYGPRLAGREPVELLDTDRQMLDPRSGRTVWCRQTTHSAKRVEWRPILPAPAKEPA